jgi:5-methylcytosine-specific restriction enzyme A
MAEYKTKEQKRKFYKSKMWDAVRQQALKRDNWECQRCRKLGFVHVDSVKVEGERKKIELNVHHVREIEEHPDLAYELENTQTVCVPCHNAIHEKGFKPKENKWADDEKW